MEQGIAGATCENYKVPYSAECPDLKSAKEQYTACRRDFTRAKLELLRHQKGSTLELPDSEQYETVSQYVEAVHDHYHTHAAVKDQAIDSLRAELEQKDKQLHKGCKTASELCKLRQEVKMLREKVERRNLQIWQERQLFSKLLVIPRDQKTIAQDSQTASKHTCKHGKTLTKTPVAKSICCKDVNHVTQPTCGATKQNSGRAVHASRARGAHSGAHDPHCTRILPTHRY